jgi:tetratricopeptide (TPR) repeat protein
MLESSLQHLVDIGEYRKAADYLDAKAGHTPSERLLRIELEQHLGDPMKALELAEALLLKPLEKIHKIEALAIVGRCHGWLGAPERGIPLLLKAIGMASEEAPFLEAELRARYAQDVLSWIGVEPALAELPRLRHAALRSGNKQALSRYHITRANICAMRGSLDLAHVELDHASDLLACRPHAEISWLVKHFRGSIASMDGRLQEARVEAEETLQLARDSGVGSRVAYALGNLANVLAAEGSFALARPKLEESLATLRPLSRARLAALNTGIHVGLATNDDILAGRMVTDGLELIARLGGDWWYYRLWFELNRVRWLIHNRDFDQALQLSTAAL